MIKYALVLGLLVVGVIGSPQNKEAGKKEESVNTRGFFGGGHQGGGFGHQGGGFGGGFGQPGGGFGGGHVGGGFGGGHVGGGFGGGHVGGGFGGGHVGGGFGGGFGGQAPPATCQHWCKTPEGQAFCCKGNNQPSRPDSFRGGFCPAVRAVCPVRSHFGPPVTCSQHGDCSFNNRCCFDRCLGENVCKQALPHNPNFG